MALSALVASACGNSPSVSPIAPSPAGTTGATISGQVNGGSGLRGLTATTGASGEPLTVTVEGTAISVTADSRGQFSLTGLPEGTLRLRFRGPGTDARLNVTVGPNEQITIAVTVSGSSATLESEHRSGRSESAVELEGRITEIIAGPPRTIRVSGSLVNVPTTAVIRHGGTTIPFADLKVGDRVHVKGTRQTDGVLATEVNVQSQNEQAAVEVEGVVAGLTGTCPTLTFTVDGTSVVTEGATFFKEGSCASLQNDVHVEVKGRWVDNRVVAAVVEVEDETDEEDDEDDDNEGMKVEGVVADRSGTCPAITFMIGTTRVVADAATKFDDIACTAVLNGTSVEVRGTRQANNDFKAAKIEPND
jgi:hypothetical protein